jgi:hypothetical protein
MTLPSFEYLERARRLVDQNVLVCQSMLIAHLLTRNDIPGFTWDDVTNLCDDSTDAIEEYLTHQTDLDPDDWNELPFDERETLGQEHGFEPEPHEIYEWWGVTPYLAQRLSGIGQPILDNDFGTWWGRTCTGQAIYIDHVIARLLRDGFVDP